MAHEVAFGSIRKSPDSVRLITLEWFPLVADFWEPSRQHSTSDIVRPLVATGFAYQASGAGQSGDREPAWPRALNGTVTDGSITWTAIAAGANGVTAVSSPSVTVSPSGELSAGVASVINGDGTNTRVQFTLSGGTVGKRYLVKVQVTAGSETLIGSFWVSIVVR